MLLFAGAAERKMMEAKPQLNPSEWVDRHGDYLFAYAVSRVRNESAAEGLLQETFLSAIQSIEKFIGKNPERAWLTGILKDKIIGHFRQKSLGAGFAEDEASLADYQGLFNDALWKDHWSEEAIPVEWDIAPEKALEKEGFCGVLSHCIGELPERVADAFTLHELEGMGRAEICDILGISDDNYWAMLHRARMHLRRCLEYAWFRKSEAKGEGH